MAESPSISMFGLRGDYTATSLRSTCTCADGNRDTMRVRRCHAIAVYMYEPGRLDALLLRSKRLYITRLTRLLRSHCDGAASGMTVIRSCCAPETILSDLSINRGTRWFFLSRFPAFDQNFGKGPEESGDMEPIRTSWSCL